MFVFSTPLIFNHPFSLGGAIVEIFDDVTFSSPEIKTALMSHEYSLDNQSEIRYISNLVKPMKCDCIFPATALKQEVLFGVLDYLSLTC